MISPNEIDRRLRERPFLPFFVRLTNGTVHRIGHPEQAIVTNRSMYVGLPRNDSVSKDDYHDFALVSLLHVVQMDPIGELPDRRGITGITVEQT
jgi:hypothetical protein